MVDTYQLIIAIIIGIFNFGFTILRTIERGPKVIFPSPYFTVLKNGHKFSLQGLITNKGDQSTIVYLHNPSVSIHGDKHFASTIAARDAESKSHLGTKFTLLPGEFREIDFAIEISDPNSDDLILIMIFEYVNKSGNLELQTQSIKFIMEPYEVYQKYLTL